MNNDGDRVSQSVRLCGRLVLEARKDQEGITVEDFLCPGHFDLVDKVAMKLSLDKKHPALNVSSVGLL